MSPLNPLTENPGHSPYVLESSGSDLSGEVQSSPTNLSPLPDALLDDAHAPPHPRLVCVDIGSDQRSNFLRQWLIELGEALSFFFPYLAAARLVPQFLTSVVFLFVSYPSR